MIGDQADFLFRLKRIMPRWFGAGDIPVLDAILRGTATVFAWLYSLYSYAALQTRLTTSTDGWLDLLSIDFFGTGLPRLLNESDDAFRARIRTALFKEKGTRNAVYLAVLGLTGIAPDIMEPQRPLDTGGWGVRCGWGTAGRWGSRLLHNQAFITVTRPSNASGRASEGFDGFLGGWGTGRFRYASRDEVKGVATDAAIYAAIDAVKPAGSIMWVHIQDHN